MIWLFYILVHLFRPQVATPPVTYLCDRLEGSTGEEVTCVEVAGWLHRVGYPDEARRLLLEISNGF